MRLWCLSWWHENLNFCPESFSPGSSSPSSSPFPWFGINLSSSSPPPSTSHTSRPDQVVWHTRLAVKGESHFLRQAQAQAAIILIMISDNYDQIWDNDWWPDMRMISDSIEISDMRMRPDQEFSTLSAFSPSRHFRFNLQVCSYMIYHSHWSWLSYKNHLLSKFMRIILIISKASLDETMTALMWSSCI